MAVKSCLTVDETFMVGFRQFFEYIGSRHGVALGDSQGIRWIHHECDVIEV